MDVAKFHMALLGIDQGRTAVPFQLTDEAQRLYDAHAEHDIRGFDDAPGEDAEQFLATFVLGLSMTGGEHMVVLAVPRPYTDWAFTQTKIIARHVFRTRRGNTAAIIGLRKAFQQINVVSRVLQIPEPERWVAFGFRNQGPIPAWMKGRLL